MKRDVESVYCEFKYSGLAATLILALSGATLALVWTTPLTLAVRGAVSLWIAASAIEAVGRIACRRGPRAAGAFRVQLSGEIDVLGTTGEWRSGAVQSGSFVAPWLTIVRWRPARARFDRTLLVLPGMVDRETFRRLRVLLRWC
jgi:hypothetical protein